METSESRKWIIEDKWQLEETESAEEERSSGVKVNILRNCVITKNIRRRCVFRARPFLLGDPEEDT